jgi:polyhydroxyalkanoate synthesis regulator phasin
MTEEQKKRPDPADAFREGVRAVTGILGALREAVEQTFEDLKDKGDLSPERAKEAARETMKRAQDAVEEVRERLEFVPRREFEQLKDEVAELRSALEAHREQAVHHTHDRETAAPGAEGGSGV